MSPTEAYADSIFGVGLLAPVVQGLVTDCGGNVDSEDDDCENAIEKKLRVTKLFDMR